MLVPTSAPTSAAKPASKGKPVSKTKAAPSKKPASKPAAPAKKTSSTTKKATSTTKKIPGKKSAASTTDKTSYEDMISAAIRADKENSRAGLSRLAIKKYLQQTYRLPDNPTSISRMNLAIKRGAEKGVFSLPKGMSGKVKLAPGGNKSSSDKSAASTKPKAAATTVKKPAATTTKKPATASTGTKKAPAKKSASGKKPAAKTTTAKAAPAKKAVAKKAATTTGKKAAPAKKTVSSTSKKVKAGKK